MNNEELKNENKSLKEFYNTNKMIQDLMAIYHKLVIKKDGSQEIMYSVGDVKKMLLEIEAWGYGRAEMFIHNGMCDICGGKGEVDRWNSYTGKKENPPFDKICCYKCGGDGKLPSKHYREEINKYKL